MSFTTTLTAKNQLTLPKSVREKLGVKRGVKFDIYPTLDGGFIGKPRRKSNIMKFASNLKSKDDGSSWTEIREKTEKIVAEEIATKFEKINSKPQ